MSDKEKSKKPTRKLEEIDHMGRVTSTRIVHDMDDIILDCFPELKEEYEKIQDKKKKGDVLPFLSK